MRKTGTFLSPQSWSIYTILSIAACLAYVAWVLSLPLFPSQDGPMHLYYVGIFRALLFSKHSTYLSFYGIKHILPPYSLYYYSLMLLTSFVPAVTADKIIICFYFLLFVSGFRYFAKTIGPNAEIATLLATTLLLNWPLVMGFVNFCISLSLVFWALGIWRRSRGKQSLGGRLAFVLLTFVITLTHPVPLLFLLVYCGFDVLLRSVQWKFRQGKAAWPPFFGMDLMCVAIATLNLGYVKLFTSPNPLQQLAQHGTVLDNVRIYSTLQGLDVFSGHEWDVRFVRVVLTLVLVGALAVGVRSAVGSPETTRPIQATLWLWASVGIAVMMLFLPHDLNGSYYFADRLLILLWIAALLALAGSNKISRPVAGGIVLLAVLANCAILHTANRTLRPVADVIAGLNQPSSASIQGKLGLLVIEVPDLDRSLHNLAYQPYSWSIGHFFRVNDAVLYNEPWLHLQIIPIREQFTSPARYATSNELGSAAVFDSKLSHSSEARKAALADVGFVVFMRPPDAPATAADRILTADDDGKTRWTCSQEKSTWLKVCTKEP